MERGLDVSAVQNLNGPIPWDKVRAAGYSWVGIRCGVGNDAPDRWYDRNRDGAKAVGLAVLDYHFLYPLPGDPPSRQPKAQAQAHFALARGDRAAVDLEWPTPDIWAKWGCTGQQIADHIDAYLAEYESLSGRLMVCYTYPYWAASVPLSAAVGQRPLWLASYEAQPRIPKPWNKWLLWQTTGGGGILPGTGLAVDTDVCRDLSWSSSSSGSSQPQE